MFIKILEAIAKLGTEARKRNVLWVSVPSLLPAPLAGLYAWMTEHSASAPVLFILVGVWLLVTSLSWFIGFKDGRFEVWTPVIPNARWRRNIAVSVVGVALLGTYGAYVLAEQPVTLVLRKGEGTEAYANVLEAQLARGLIPQRVRLASASEDPKKGVVLETVLRKAQNQITVYSILRIDGVAQTPISREVKSDDPEALNRLVEEVGQEVVRAVTPFVRKPFLPDLYLRNLAESRSAFSSLTYGIRALDIGDYTVADSAFENALARDPNAVEALSRRGEVFVRMGLANYIPADSAFRTARKFLSLAPKTPETLLAQGQMALLYEWDPQKAEALFGESLNLGGSVSEARSLQGLAHLSRGQVRRARVAMEESVKAADKEALEPRMNLGIILYYAGDYDSARVVMQDVQRRNSRKLEPSRDVEHLAQVWTLLIEARRKNSQMVEETFSNIRIADQKVLLAYAQAQSILGANDRAKAAMDSLNRAFCPDDPRVPGSPDCAATRPAYWTASYYATRGQNDSTFRWLRLALQDCRHWNWGRGCQSETRFIKSDPAFAPLRDTPSFRALMTEFHAPRSAVVD